MNYNIRKLEDDIVAILNASDVPIEAKRLILADVSRLVEKKADESISLEIKMKMEEKEHGIREKKLAEHAEHANADQRGKSKSH